MPAETLDEMGSSSKIKFSPGEQVLIKTKGVDIIGTVVGFKIDDESNMVYLVETGDTAQMSKRSGGASYYDPTVQAFKSRQLRRWPDQATYR